MIPINKIVNRKGTVIGWCWRDPETGYNEVWRTRYQAAWSLDRFLKGNK